MGAQVSYTSVIRFSIPRAHSFETDEAKLDQLKARRKRMHLTV